MTDIWQANGMLQSDNQYRVDLAMTYIKQLLSRGFFQEFEDYKLYANFKMHDLVHDLALLVGKRDFINVHSQKLSDHLSYRFARHISFPKDYFSMKEIPNQLLEQKGNVRTITFPYGVGDSKESFVRTCISKFKSLRMLELEYSSFELPSSVGGMKYLKNLNVSRNTRLKSLPASICELVGLEILDFSWCLEIEKLPSGFGKLTHLKKLGISTKESCLPDNELRCLTSLQYLSISKCPNLKFVMADDTMQCLSELAVLDISRSNSLVSLPLRGMRHLTRLKYLIIAHCKNLNLEINQESDDGATNSIGGEHGFRSLLSLDLSNLPKLEILPSWLFLATNNLQRIHIYNCGNLINLMKEEEVKSLKSLQTLYIFRCPKLVGLPEGIQNLTTLKVEIEDCPQLIREGDNWEGLAQDLPSRCFTLSPSMITTTT